MSKLIASLDDLELGVLILEYKIICFTGSLYQGFKCQDVSIGMDGIYSSTRQPTSKIVSIPWLTTTVKVVKCLCGINYVMGEVCNVHKASSSCSNFQKVKRDQESLCEQSIRKLIFGLLFGVFSQLWFKHREATTNV